MFERVDGCLQVEGVRLSRLLALGLPTPFFLYSRRQLQQNLAAYTDAVRGLSATVGYAVKANHNPAILREFSARGAGAIVASALELRLALSCGFPAGQVVLHGNGKRPEDIAAAIHAGVTLSVDSPFDLTHIEAEAKRAGVRARLLLRVNPDVDPQVHPYISTGMHDDKFGMDKDSLTQIEEEEIPGLRHGVVCGLHCHIGSSLTSARPFLDAARIILPLALRMRAKGHPIDTVNLGGGLGIDYERRGAALPTPRDLIDPIREEILAAGLRLILEPGRSLVGNAGALIGRVLGIKHNPRKSFLITDASMAQLIRPSLYGAYHHIELLDPPSGPERRHDVVGPLCESGDFLGQDRLLGSPKEGDGLCVFDAGAYGFSMASRYNLHLLPAEYLVDGRSLLRVRRAETWADLVATATDEEIPIEPCAEC